MSDIVERLENWLYREPKDRGHDAEEGAATIKDRDAEIKRLHDEADYWQQKIDEGKVEIERLRAALWEIIKVERDLFDGDTLAYQYAKEALGDDTVSE